MTGWFKSAVAVTAVASIATLGAVIAAQDVQLSDEIPDQVIKAFTFGGRLGISIRDVSDDDIKKAKGLTQGVIVEEVDVDSAALKAGIKTGDAIVEFDGERVRTARQFTRLVQESPVGRAVPIVVMRDGQRVTLSVERRDDPPSFSYFNSMEPLMKFPKVAPALPFKIDGGGRLGISIQELSSQLAEYFGTKEGVLVTSVADNSNASRAGLKAGDVITSFDGQSVTSTSALVRRTQRLDPGDEFTVSVIRDKKSMTLKGKLEQPQPRRVTGARTIL
jgi:serine protease Do